MRIGDVFGARGGLPPESELDQHERGFTFVELMITVAILAIAAMVALPALRPDDPLKVIGAATMLASDLEYAQSATLSNPSDPTIVQFAEAQPRYWLALQSDPATPILRANGKPYEVHFGQDGAQYLGGMSVELEDDPGGAIHFDAFGRLVQTTDARVIVGNTSGALTVTVRSTTGSVAIAE